MKGIILAGGSGSRLYPLTKVTSKQLLPIYDKPMIFYPLSTLMEAGIRDILIISAPQDIGLFQHLLGNGSQFGISLSYCIQPQPLGIAEAFLLGKDFINNAPVTLILGDNIFIGDSLKLLLLKAISRSYTSPKNATIFGIPVKDPQRFGVIEFDKHMRALSIEEKPLHPKSNYCITGLYIYDSHVCDIAASLSPSPRGELEISDVNNHYLHHGILQVELLDHNFIWMDTGTPDSFTDAAITIRSEEHARHRKIGCPEEISYKNGWITEADILLRKNELEKNPYGKYVLNLIAN